MEGHSSGGMLGAYHGMFLSVGTIRIRQEICLNTDSLQQILGRHFFWMPKEQLALQSLTVGFQDQPMMS